MATGSCSAAFFDIDGTLTRTNIVIYYVALALKGRRAISKTVWYAGFAFKVVLFLILDKISRRWFNVFFYRGYRGCTTTELDSVAGENFKKITHPRLFASGAQQIKEHQDSGEIVVFVTGTLDVIAAPLAELLGVEHVMSVSLSERDGVCTGGLTGPPLSDVEKARRVREFADEHDIDLSASFAYGDSAADRAMLEAVGNPVAVNPDRSLGAHAKEHGWQVRHWADSSH